MAIGVLIVGDEILSGRREDKHFAQARALLAGRGLRLAWVRFCGDDRPRLTETLRQCVDTGDIVFSFGGIGATPDDHTRQAAAAALGVALKLHPEAGQAIRDRFGDQTTPKRLEMGEFPVGARVLPNPYNGIPGFAVGRLYCLPGFPVMAWPMMEWVLDTELRALHHAEPFAEEALSVFDAQESQIADLMAELERRFGVTVFSLPDTLVPGGRRRIELGAKGKPGAVAAAMDAMRRALAERGFEVGPAPVAERPGS